MKRVNERQDAYDLSTGPYGFERVGFEHEGRVFWVGTFGYGMNNGKQYDADCEFVDELVRRWNQVQP